LPFADAAVRNSDRYRTGGRARESADLGHFARTDVDQIWANASWSSDWKYLSEKSRVEVHRLTFFQVPFSYRAMTTRVMLTLTLALSMAWVGLIGYALVRLVQILL
jgi:hypothetical protein